MERKFFAIGIWLLISLGFPLPFRQVDVKYLCPSSKKKCFHIAGYARLSVRVLRIQWKVERPQNLHLVSLDECWWRAGPGSQLSSTYSLLLYPCPKPHPLV